MARLIDADELLKEFSNKGIHIEFDLPVEEILGEDVDLDDFTMLMQDGVMSYKKLVIDTIKNQPTAYDLDKVVEELEKMTRGVGTTINDNCVIGVRRGYEKASRRAIEIVRAGGKNDN